jgi:hypothetical protein
MVNLRQMVGQLNDVLFDATAALSEAELAVYCNLHIVSLLNRLTYSEI